MAHSILIVDDKPNVQRLLVDFLSGKGFTVHCAANGHEAFRQLDKHDFDLILLDIMMPKMDGYDFISKLRMTSNLPVIMITAKQQEGDVVKGFELGADDYVTKPFKVNELLVRVKAVLKRTIPDVIPESFIKIGHLTLDKSGKTLYAGQKDVELTLAELSIMQLFMESADRTVTKAVLCTHLINEGYSGSESTLKIHIRNLRLKLESLENDDVEIESIFGIGYRMRTCCT